MYFLDTETLMKLKNKVVLDQIVKTILQNKLKAIMEMSIWNFSLYFNFQGVTASLNESNLSWKYCLTPNNT